MKKYYMVTAENGMESELLETKEQAEKWVYENLPVGIQKFRSGGYDILEVDENGD